MKSIEIEFTVLEIERVGQIPGLCESDWCPERVARFITQENQVGVGCVFQLFTITVLVIRGLRAINRQAPEVLDHP